MVPARPSTADATGAAHAPPDPFRLARCPGCGYSLAGLPDAGACPECGRAYDPQTIVLYGWARGGKVHIGNARPWMVPLLLLYHSVGLLQIAFDPAWRTPLGLSMWALAGALIGWTLWRRGSVEDPGLVQVHLDPTGCRQFDVARPPAADAAPAPWRDVGVVEVEPAGAVGSGRMRIRLAKRVQWWQLEDPFVDAEVRCGDQHVAALRALLEEWRRRHAVGT